MKKLKYLYKTLFLTIGILLIGCEEENYEFGDLISPSNLQVESIIVGADADNPYGNGTGQVIFRATAQDAITYKYVYGTESTMAPNGEKSYNFSNTGIHTYSVTVIAVGRGGVGSSKTVEVEVLALYEPPEDLIEMLTGGSSKAWRVKAESAGHMGVGPPDSDSPDWWSAGAYEKSHTGMYDDEFVFNIDGSILYSTKGTIFGKAPPLEEDFGEISEEPNSDDEHEHYPKEGYSSFYSLTAPGGQETINLGKTGYQGFYVGGNYSYSIISRSADEMVLRTIGYDGNGWFMIMTSRPAEEEDTDPEYTELIWQDEFDTDGAPSDANWGYDIGTGSNGWGNGEQQYYTDRTDNVSVADGVLKITAKKESYQGSDYTSARLLTQDKFEFTYGRVDVRAKLAGGGGTWPAIWMLGANFNDVGWPACGEIDIMEYVGNNPGTVQSAIHNTSSSGDTVNKESTSVTGETDEFHLYSVIWSEEQITFLVDDVKFYTYRPETQDDATWPFDADQFLILNVAMGGSLGGNIDPDFTESTMEIDYVRVYQ